MERSYWRIDNGRAEKVDGVERALSQSGVYALVGEGGELRQRIEVRDDVVHATAPEFTTEEMRALEMGMGGAKDGAKWRMEDGSPESWAVAPSADWALDAAHKDLSDEHEGLGAEAMVGLVFAQDVEDVRALRDRLLAVSDPNVPVPVERAAMLALVDEAIAAQEMGMRLKVAALAADELPAALSDLRTAKAQRQADAEELRALREHSRLHPMGEAPPADGMYLVWQRWKAESLMAGMATTIRAFVDGRWIVRAGTDIGWTFLPKGVV